MFSDVGHQTSRRLPWTCPVCATPYDVRPFPPNIIGCPHCGNYPDECDE